MAAMVPRRQLTATLALALGLVTLAPSSAFACACGCAIFDVGTNTLLPGGAGGTAFIEYDYLAQTRNWHEDSSAPASDNDDKRITSNFFLAGFQYMFEDGWGAMAEIPYTSRNLRTAEPGDPGTFSHAALGDIRLMGMYSGFSSDMSSGVLFGLKLPTGDHTYKHFGADVEIGSGSTDALLGGYDTGAFVFDSRWSYFMQALWQHEIATQDHYTPGSELNAAAGISYNGWNANRIGVVPSLQLIVSQRGRDGGANGEPENTGYTRLLISPGASLRLNDNWKLYADVEVPVYQHVNGNQLVAPAAFKFVVSHGF